MISYSHRIFIYGPVAALLLLLVAYSIYWQASASQLATQLDKANGREVMPGVVFAFAEKEIGGYPFRLDAVLGGVTFVNKGARGETAWRTEHLALHMLSYGPNHFLFEAAGLQSFAWPGVNRVPHVFYVTPTLARASAILKDGKLERFDLDVIGFDAQDAAPSATPGSNVFAGRAQLHLRANDNHMLDAAIKIENTSIGPGYEPALGPNLPLLTLKGSFSHGETLDALLGGVDSFANAAETWRKANGMIDVSDMTVDWSDVELNAKGTLAFDAGHRPAGSIKGLITGGRVLNTAVAISVYTGTEADAQGRVSATLTLQNGEMHLGKMLITTLAPVY